MPDKDNPSSVLFDLIKFTQGWDFNLATAEDPDEKRVRIEVQRKAAVHKIWRGTTLFSVALIGLLALGSACVWMLLDSSTTSDTKKLAETILMSIITGAAGFLVGKAAR